MLFNTQNYGIRYKMNEFTYPTVLSLMRDKSLEKTQQKKVTESYFTYNLF